MAKLKDIDSLVLKWKSTGDVKYDIGFEDGIDYVLNEIDKIPIIEVNSIVHAHWIGSNGTCCSHCERSYMDIADADSYDSGDIPNFCPWCGAIMD